MHFSLSTQCCICVFHYSKQCYSSSTPRPFSSCAVFALTSLTDGKWVPFSTLFTLVYRKKSRNLWIWRMFKYSNAFIGKKLLEQKGVVAGALSWCSIQTLFFQRFGRFFRKICHTVSVLISTMSTIILTLRRRSLRTISLIFWMFWSIFEVEVWPGLLIIFHFLPTLTKSFVSLKHAWTWH